MAKGDGFRIRVGLRMARAKDYAVPSATQQDFSPFFRDLAKISEHASPTSSPTRSNIPGDHSLAPSADRERPPQILVGYGDPAVLKAIEGWWLVSTSNDAPDAFPILHSADLQHWEPRVSSFPRGGGGLGSEGPQRRRFLGARDGQGRRRILAGVHGATGQQCAGDRACSGAVAARALDRQPCPAHHRQAGQHNGPRLRCRSAANERRSDRLAPVRGCERRKYLFWKDDTNSIWPRPLAMLLRKHPELIEKLFARSRSSHRGFRRRDRAMGQRAAANGALFLMQPLIEAALANWTQVRTALVEFGLAGRSSKP